MYVPSPLLVGPALILFATPIAGFSTKLTGVLSERPPLPLLVSGFVPLSDVSLTVAPLGLVAPAVAVLLYAPRLVPGVTVTVRVIVSLAPTTKLWLAANKFLSVPPLNALLMVSVPPVLFPSTTKVAPLKVVVKSSTTCTLVKLISPVFLTTIE